MYYFTSVGMCVNIIELNIPKHSKYTIYIMCGIFALLNESLDNEEYQRIWNNFMLGSYRGPEFSTFDKVFSSTYFGFHRLAINGLNTKSNQPLHYNGVTLICNGEIYNYKELCKESNIKMVTDSDCEIIIHLYLKYGFEQMIQMIDGVFAFILLDLAQSTPKMFVSRDPFGVRPLFHYANDTTSSFGYSSELKMILGLDQIHQKKYNITPFQPGTWQSYEFTQCAKWKTVETRRYFTLSSLHIIHSIEEAKQSIYKSFVAAIKKRVTNTDRPVACLLSGGLDSSLVCALVSKFYSNSRHTLETYSIGMEGSVDLKYARKVADHIHSKHTELVVTEQEFLDAIPEVICAIESFDTTTVRASVGNYLICKYIKKHSKAKVIFNGDGADEVCGGYMYFHCAPDYYYFDAECKRLLKDIHYFDVLRSDRSISSNGLEARTPFLDKTFVQQYLSILPSIRCHATNKLCEKWLLRSTFQSENLLPAEVLWRTKEAFSDGVSSQRKSWYETIQEHVAKLNMCHSDDAQLHNLTHLPPTTDEQKYYRSLFQSYYGTKCSHVIPYFWMPKFVDGATDSSARTLDVYQQQMKLNVADDEQQR